MRNPWGSSEWNGQWSDTDPFWNENLDYKNFVIEKGFEQGNDGIFYISIADYQKHFFATNWSYNVDMYHYTSWSWLNIDPVLDANKLFFPGTTIYCSGC